MTSLLGQIRFYGTVLLAALALVVLLPFHFIALYVSGRSTMKVAQLWQRFVCFLIGIRVTVTGAPADERPLLLLSNHNSWLDIPILASVAPVSFVAKREVASWPMVGFLARTQRTVFVDRDRRHATGAQADEIAGRLSKGDIIVLFAEGTSSDGNKVLPFRSALVGAAQRAIEDGGVATVQPVAIAYKRMLGLPLGRQHRPLVAWYGGTDLLPHLKRILSEGGIDVNVVFGPARTLSAADNRKAATQQAGELVRKLVSALNGGRDPSDVLEVAAQAPALVNPREPSRRSSSGGRGVKLLRALVCGLGSMGCIRVSAAMPGAPIELYQAKPIVTGTGEKNRQIGFALAFEDVLVKVSGDPRLIGDPRVARARQKCWLDGAGVPLP